METRMIDLHMHTNYSDGTDSVIDLLKKAQKKQLEIISITDHNNCKAYDELEKIDIKKYYTGAIIKGVELTTKISGVSIELLGYDVDTKIINKEAKKMYETSTKGNLKIILQWNMTKKNINIRVYTYMKK